MRGLNVALALGATALLGASAWCAGGTVEYGLVPRWHGLDGTVVGRAPDADCVAQVLILGLIAAAAATGGAFLAARRAGRARFPRMTGGRTAATLAGRGASRFDAGGEPGPATAALTANPEPVPASLAPDRLLPVPPLVAGPVLAQPAATPPISASARLVAAELASAEPAPVGKADIGLWTWDGVARLVSGDACLARMTGLDPGQLAAGLPLPRYLARVHAADRATVEAGIAGAAGAGAFYAADYRVTGTDGVTRPIAVRGRCERPPAAARSDHREPLRISAVAAGAGVPVEENTLTGTARLQRLVERIPATIAVFDPGMRYLAASERYLSDYRLAPETSASVVGRLHYDLFPDMPERWRDVHRRVLAGETLACDEDAFVRQDGRTDWLQWEMSPWYRPDSTIGGAILVSSFVTARRRAEEALRVSEQRYRAALKGASIAVFEQDLKLRYTWIDNPALGYGPVDVIGRTDFDLFDHVEDAVTLTTLKRRVIDSGAGLRQEVRVRSGDRDQSFQLSVEPLRSAEGAIIGVSCAAVDVTERRTIEAALRESETRLRLAVEAAGLGIYDVDLTSGEARWSAEHFALLGVAPTPGARSHMTVWRDCVHPDDIAAVDEAWRRCIEDGERYYIVYRIRRADDGAERWVEAFGRPNGPPGEATRFFGVMVDITGRKRAEGILRDANAELERRVAERTRALTDAGRELQSEMRRREEAQASLLQAQKLEALGQLTGGVAHDFNNVLAAILGSFELLSSRITDERLRRFVATGERAARRAEALVRQLLAFARREQLTPVTVEPDVLLQESAPLLRHAAGTRVECTLEVTPGTWPILADVHQLEVALLNLTVNARDAMPESGRLTISARNAEAEETRPPGLGTGDYVVLAVHDTGAGMTADVLARATEPFFTTKEAGQGTGLGLAMVHGFAAQSNGALRIQSEMGVGTRVEVWLPRAAARVAQADGTDPAPDPRLHGDATLLVVDDDDQVRPITAGFLRELGYTVIEAVNAEAAAVLAHAAGRIDLVVTDVVMPGADGPALAVRLRAEWPDVPILFVTGHADRSRLEGEAVLAKPFTSRELGRRVLERLGRSSEGAADSLLDARLRTPELREAYLAWRRARRPERLPLRSVFDLSALSSGPHAFLVSVTEGPERLRFRYVSVGQALTSRLGSTVDGTSPAADDALGSLEDGYRRCVRTGAPTYEYTRYRMGNEPPVLFERLLLPLSDDGQTVTALAGVAMFVNLPEGQ